MLHNFVVMPHEGPSHSTLETRNPEPALYDSYKEVAGQASLEPSQFLALNESESSTSKPRPPVQTHDAELPANEECSAKKETRPSRDYSRKNHVAVACLAVALAGIIVTAAIIGIKTSQHGSPQTSIIPVAPSSISTRLFRSREQTTSRLRTTATVSDAASAAQTPSNVDHTTVTTSLAPSANLPQPTTSIKSSRPKVTATLNARTVTALDQLTPTNCLQSSDIWKGPLTVDSPDTCDGT